MTYLVGWDYDHLRRLPTLPTSEDEVELPPAIMSFHVVTSAIGILALSLMEWKRKTRRHLSHKSLTLLIDMHSFWTFLLCVSTLVNNLKTLHAHLTMRIPRDIFVSASTCLVWRSPFIFAAYGSIFSQLAIAVERYQASKAYTNYEHSSRTVGYWLIAHHFPATFLCSIAHLFFYFSDWTAVHCTFSPPSVGPVQIVLTFVILLCELTTIVTFRPLLTCNIHIRVNAKERLSLTERYQLTENIRMIKLFKPIIWSHTSLGIIASVLFLLFKSIYGGPEMYPMIEETINMIHLQGICMPLIFAYRHREERMHKKRLFLVNTAKGSDLAAHHAKSITEGW